MTQQFLDSRKVPEVWDMRPRYQGVKNEAAAILPNSMKVFKCFNIWYDNQGTQELSVLPTRRLIFSESYNAMECNINKMEICQSQAVLVLRSNMRMGFQNVRSDKNSKLSEVNIKHQISSIRPLNKKPPVGQGKSTGQTLGK